VISLHKKDHPQGGVLCKKSGKGYRSEINLPGSPQKLPRYIEVLPNIEGQPIGSTFSIALSKLPNNSLLKDNFNFLLFPRCWQEYCYIFIAGIEDGLQSRR